MDVGLYLSLWIHVPPTLSLHSYATNVSESGRLDRERRAARPAAPAPMTTARFISSQNKNITHVGIT